MKLTLSQIADFEQNVVWREIVHRMEPQMNKMHDIAIEDREIVGAKAAGEYMGIKTILDLLDRFREEIE